MTKKPQKSESLSIRLDPKTRFMLEFVSRLRGQTITTVIERAIMDAADQASFRPENENDVLTWRDFWDIEESIRALKICDQPDLRPAYEEEKRIAFAKKNWQFFYTSADCKRIHRHYVTLLWPKIDEFIAIDEEQRSTDYFAAAKQMSATLKAAQIVAPDYPPTLKKTTVAPTSMDDDIPF